MRDEAMKNFKDDFVDADADADDDCHASTTSTSSSSLGKKEDLLGVQDLRWEAFHAKQNGTAKFFKERRYVPMLRPMAIGIE